MGSLDPTQDRLTIQTGGQTLDGWLSSTVSRGVELCPSHFSCSITEKYPGKFTQAVVDPGNTCKVFLGGDLIITGFIDEYSPSYDGHNHNVRISGRSNTEDVVDSSYWQTQPINGKSPWQFSKGQSLKQVVTQILAQFQGFVSLTMDDADDVMLPDQYDIQPGESAYAAIEELTRMCARLLYDDEQGNLVIAQIKSTRAGSALVEGVNVEAAVTRRNWVQRFHNIKVIGAGAIISTGGINVHSVADATPDSEVRGDRIKVIPMGSYLGPDLKFAQQRAEWEMNRRIGRSLMVQVHVVGWRDGAGNLWKPNTVVSVHLPQQKIEDDLQIAECEWTRDENGTRTIITCMPPNALQPAPFIPRVGSGQSLTSP